MQQFKHVLVGLALTLLGSAFAITPVERYGQLSIQNGHMVGQDGQAVALHGMSYSWSQWFYKYWTPSSVTWLRDNWKVNIIRAPMAVDSGGWISNPDFNEALLEMMIKAAIDNGVYIIVDWHAHLPHPEEAAGFFERMAQKYGQYPNVIWETFNEPLPEFAWSSVLKPYHQKVVAAIRKHDPDNIIVLGTRTWSQDVDEAANDPLEGSNLAYTLHFYAATHKQSLRDKADYAISKGLPLFVTEWGTSEADGKGKLDTAETKTWMDWMTKNGLSWANWALLGSADTSAALKAGADPEGGWRDLRISPSGKLVRSYLLELNP